MIIDGHFGGLEVSRAVYETLDVDRMGIPRLPEGIRHPSKPFVAASEQFGSEDSKMHVGSRNDELMGDLWIVVLILGNWGFARGCFLAFLTVRSRLFRFFGDHELPEVERYLERTSTIREVNRLRVDWTRSWDIGDRL
jgi:hypothetical protein